MCVCFSPSATKCIDMSYNVRQCRPFSKVYHTVIFYLTGYHWIFIHFSTVRTLCKGQCKCLQKQTDVGATFKMSFSFNCTLCLVLNSNTLNSAEELDKLYTPALQVIRYRYYDIVIVSLLTCWSSKHSIVSKQSSCMQIYFYTTIPPIERKVTNGSL